MAENKPKARPKLAEVTVQTSDVQNIVDLTLKTLRGRPQSYPDTPEGLEKFKQKSYEYFEYLKTVNDECEDERQTIVPDTESYTLYLSISRQTLNVYEKQRGSEWGEFIGLCKSAIVACKKNLAYHGKVPPVLMIFDLCNNNGYSNTSEFKLQPVEAQAIDKPLTADMLPRLDISNTDRGISATELPRLGLGESED